MDYTKNIDTKISDIYYYDIILTIITCALIIVVHGGEQFTKIIGKFTITITIAIIVLIILSSLKIICFSKYFKYVFIIIYLFICYKLNDYSKMILFYFFFFSLIGFLIYSQYHNIQGKFIEKKLNKMCYGKKHLDGFSKYIEADKCDPSKTVTRFGYRRELIGRLKLLTKLIQVGIVTIPFDSLKNKPLDQLEHILNKKMNKYNLNEEILEKKNLTFISYIIMFKDEYGIVYDEKYIESLTLEELFLRFESKRLGLNYDESDIDTINIIIFAENVGISMDSKSFDSKSYVHILAKVSPLLKKEGLTFTISKYIGIYNLINLYKVRKSKIMISEEDLFSMEQVAIDGLLHFTKTNKKGYEMSYRDCYHILNANKAIREGKDLDDNDLGRGVFNTLDDKMNDDLNDLRLLIHSLTGIDPLILAQLTLDQLNTILCMLELKQDIIKPINEKNLEKMHKICLDNKLEGKEELCSDPNYIKTMNPKIQEALLILEKINVKVDCEDIAGMSFDEFQNYIDNLLKELGYDFTLTDLLDPDLLEKILKMLENGLNIPISKLRNMFMDDVENMLLNKKFGINTDLIDNEDLNNIYDTMKECSIEHIDSIKGLTNREIILLKTACFLKIPFSFSINNIDKLEVVIPMVQIGMVDDLKSRSEWDWDETALLSKTELYSMFINYVKKQNLYDSFKDNLGKNIKRLRLLSSQMNPSIFDNTTFAGQNIDDVIKREAFSLYEYYIILDAIIVTLQYMTNVTDIADIYINSYQLFKTKLYVKEIITRLNQEYQRKENTINSDRTRMSRYAGRDEVFDVINAMSLRVKKELSMLLDSDDNVMLDQQKSLRDKYLNMRNDYYDLLNMVGDKDLLNKLLSDKSLLDSLIMKNKSINDNNNNNENKNNNDNNDNNDITKPINSNSFTKLNNGDIKQDTLKPMTIDEWEKTIKGKQPLKYSRDYDVVSHEIESIQDKYFKHNNYSKI